MTTMKRDPKNIGTDALRAFQKYGIKPLFLSFGDYHGNKCAVSMLRHDIKNDPDFDDYVDPGDNLGLVSRVYGVSVEALWAFIGGYDGSPSLVLAAHNDLFEQGQAVREMILASEES